MKDGVIPTSAGFNRLASGMRQVESIKKSPYYTDLPIQGEQRNSVFVKVTGGKITGTDVPDGVYPGIFQLEDPEYTDSRYRYRDGDPCTVHGLNDEDLQIDHVYEGQITGVRGVDSGSGPYDVKTSNPVNGYPLVTVNVGGGSSALEIVLLVRVKKDAIDSGFSDAVHIYSGIGLNVSKTPKQITYTTNGKKYGPPDFDPIYHLENRRWPVVGSTEPEPDGPWDKGYDPRFIKEWSIVTVYRPPNGGNFWLIKEIGPMEDFFRHTGEFDGDGREKVYYHYLDQKTGIWTDGFIGWHIIPP